MKYFIDCQRLLLQISPRKYPILSQQKLSILNYLFMHGESKPLDTVMMAREFGFSRMRAVQYLYHLREKKIIRVLKKDSRFYWAPGERMSLKKSKIKAMTAPDYRTEDPGFTDNETKKMNARHYPPSPSIGIRGKVRKLKQAEKAHQEWLKNRTDEERFPPITVYRGKKVHYSLMPNRTDGYFIARQKPGFTYLLFCKFGETLTEDEQENMVEEIRKREGIHKDYV